MESSEGVTSVYKLGGGNSVGGKLFSQSSVGFGSTARSIQQGSAQQWSAQQGCSRSQQGLARTDSGGGV